MNTTTDTSAAAESEDVRDEAEAHDETQADTGAEDQDGSDEGDDGGEDTGDDAAASAEGEDGDQPPKRQTAKERIDELTKQKHDAKREADEAKTRNAELEARLASIEAKLNTSDTDDTASASDPDAEPDPDEYDLGDTDPAYLKAQARYEARQAVAEERAAERQAEQAAARASKWDGQKAKAAERYEDFGEVLAAANRNEWPCPAPMAAALHESDAAADIVYYLGKNPDEARRIAALNPVSQAREIGKIEARLDAPAEDKPSPKTASDAPTPIPNARGSGGRFTTPGDSNDFAAFEARADKILAGTS